MNLAKTRNSKTRLGMLPLLLLTCFMSVSAQTATDIENKYGPRQQVYSISAHIWMTPEYSSDGQVCRMRLYPKRVDAKTNYVGAGLVFEELRDLLNSLVPPEDRGKKLKVNFGATATGGPAVWTTYPYENVNFTFSSAFRKDKYDGASLLRRGEFVFTISPADLANLPTAPESDIPSADDFLPSQSLTNEIVAISWSQRKCQE